MSLLLLFNGVAGPPPVIPTPSRATIQGRPRVEVAFPNGPYDSTPTYTEITGFLRDEQTPVKMKRGRQNELQQYDAGDFSCLLDNRVRALEPQYSGSPYYPNIQPEKKIRYTLEYPWLPALYRTSLFLFGVGEWIPSNTVAPANCTLTTVAGQGYVTDLEGGPLPSLRATATAAGDMYFENSDTFACAPGESIAYSFRAKGITMARTLEARFRWYDSSHTFLSDSITTFNIVGFTEITGSHSRFGAVGTAPAGAYYFKVIYRVMVAGAGEQHDFDAFVLQDRASFQGIYPRCVVFADSWTPQYPAGTMDAYLTLTGHDGFKLLGGKDMTDVGFRTAVLALTPSHYYRLGDPLNSLSAADEMLPNNPAIVYSDLIFGVAGGLLADINTGANFDTGYIDLGTGPSWSGTGAQSVTLLYLWEGANGHLITQGPYSDLPTYSWTLTPAGTANLDFYFIDHTSMSGPPHMGFEIPAPMADGKYHLLTLNRHSDGVTFEVFIDGQAITPNAVLANGSISGTTFVAGTNYNMDLTRTLLGTGFWDAPDGIGNSGDLDEVIIFNGSNLTLAQHKALYSLMTKAWLQQSSGSRIGAVLDLLGWPALDRNLDTGDQILPQQIDPLAGPSLKTNTLDYLRVVEQSEGGQMFMSNKGGVRLIGRHKQYTGYYLTPQAVFGDRPGTVDSATGLPELPYNLPKPEFGDATLYTEAEVTRAIPGGGQGVTQWARDPSITNNPKKDATRTGLFLMNDLEAWNYANWLFRTFSVAKYLFRQIVINPVDNDALWYQVAIREVADRIVVIKRPPGWVTGQPLIRVECFISAIEETTKRKGSQYTWMLGQISSVNWLVLDDPVYGKLDAGNYIGY